jgi:hypothetical protein
VLRRWAAAQTDRRLEFIDPFAPLVNLVRISSIFLTLGQPELERPMGRRAGVTAELFGLPSPEPFEELWALLVVLADHCGQPTVPVPPEVAGELCSWFGNTQLAGDVQRVLEAGVRVAQEALTAERLATVAFGLTPRDDRGSV